MRRFAALYESLDTTNSTSTKIEAIIDYLDHTAPEDAAWALYFLTGRKLTRLMQSALLKEAVREIADLPEWIVDESYASVGDLAETISLLLPPTCEPRDSLSLQTWVEERLLTLKGLDPELQKASWKQWWSGLSTREIFVLNKLVTGSFRAGVSQNIVVKALAKRSGLTESAIAHRLMGNWRPTREFYESLSQPVDRKMDPGVPFPFYLASPLTSPPDKLGAIDDWFVEWKWDGVRAQAIRRTGGVFLWSRGEELITANFPEIAEMVARLPQGTVLDGEILAFENDQVQPFSYLQQRIGRKRPSAQILRSVPVAYIVFDLLEFDSEDWRERPLLERRNKLAQIAEATSGLRVSPAITAKNWTELATFRDQARDRKVEGLMLKRVDSTYKVGRKRGDWWKWKVDPYTMDAVLVYAQPGHGRRATLNTDYTFAIWQGDELVPIAKAYSGLTDQELLAMDRWIRAHTTQKFGPVRQVEPKLVFELAFEGIATSSRHKSGLAVRFPRILRKRDDKKSDDADSVDKVRGILHAV